MCVPLMAAQLATQGSSPAGMTQAGGYMQAAALGLDALGSLAAGSTRARMSRQDAAGERQTAATKAERIRRAGEQELSRARAGASALNVRVDSGSVLDAERQIVRNVEQDAGVAILTGENRARALEESARYQQRAGVFSALDSGLGAIDKWRRVRGADIGGIPGRVAPRQMNPGDGVVPDPQAGW